MDDATRETIRNLVDRSRSFMGPRKMKLDEPERVERYVRGWHDALDNILEDAGIDDFDAE